MFEEINDWISWNPITGCTKISDGCKNCYAEVIAHRLHEMGNPKYKNNFQITIHEDTFSKPLKWKKPRVVFVNSMSDIFHEDVPFDVIEKLFQIMNQAYQHTFQILTKRADILYKYKDKLVWSDNIWIGVTVESSKYVERIKLLETVPAKVKYINFEPLLDDVGDIDLSKIDWAIVGGESGPNARNMKKEWIYRIIDICKRDQVPFTFRQWGGVENSTDRTLDGIIYNNMPKLFQNTLL